MAVKLTLCWNVKGIDFMWFIMDIPVFGLCSPIRILKPIHCNARQWNIHEAQIEISYYSIRRSKSSHFSSFKKTIKQITQSSKYLYTIADAKQIRKTALCKTVKYISNWFLDALEWRFSKFLVLAYLNILILCTVSGPLLVYMRITEIEPVSR